jgi:integrase
VKELEKRTAKELWRKYHESESTRYIYEKSIDLFAKFHKIPNWESILELNSTELKARIEDYLITQKDNGRSTSYLNGITFAIQNFLECFDYEGINFKKLRKINGKHQDPNIRAFTDEECRRMLSVIDDPRKIAIALFLSSSGIRRQTIPILKMNDLSQRPFGCYQVRVSSGKGGAYTTFINREAGEALQDYFELRKSKGEIFTSETLVFPKKSGKGACTDRSISIEWIKIMKKAGVATYERGVNAHAYRRRFNTIMKSQEGANISLIERLMSHKSQIVQLDNHYFRPSDDQLWEEYQKGMIALSIRDDEKTKIENQKLNNQLEQLNKDRESNKELENKVKQQQEQIEKIKQLLKSIERPRVDLNGTKVDLVFDYDEDDSLIEELIN